MPTPQALDDMRRRLVDARADLDETVRLFSDLRAPDVHRDTEYVSLKSAAPDEYAFYDGALATTRSPQLVPVADYRQLLREEVVPHSTAKHARTPHSPSYMVGALARFNHNHERLLPRARQVAGRLNLAAPCGNPFHNNTAQLVETVQCVEDAIRMIDVLLARGLAPEPRRRPARFGRGVGAVEAPRGTLFHEYAFDDKGRVEEANLVIPTAQNLANIEADMRHMIPEMLDAGMDQDEMTLRLEMLVRAYDPCISCATHFLDVEWTP
jgi:coenzyme F420-reducing hydrogenase alpha subunit